MPKQSAEDDTAEKIQQAAANIHRKAARTRRNSPDDTEAIVRRYFRAMDEHDVEGAVALWAPGGEENIRGLVQATAPEGVRAFVGGWIGAMPDLSVEVVQTTTEGERCAVQWRAKGTFAGPEAMSGVAPTGDPVELEGLDLFTVRDGLIQSNEAFSDTMAFARQIGMMPGQGSAAEQRLMGAFNTKTRVARLPEREARMVAEGVWVVQGQPGRCNVYLIEDASVGGVTLYDAGGRTMLRSVASAGAKLGGIKRIVLGHGHTDHRGTAPGLAGLGAPVLCHPDEVQDAEGSGGFRYWPKDLVGLPAPQRQIHRALHRWAWDAGPVKISGTLSEGDAVGDFKVVHLPGHAPGQIGLWRESDRLALVSDCFYTLDMWGRPCSPHVPERTYNYDTEQAQSSIRKLAEMEPAAAWPGHAKPVTGDVRSALLSAADRF